MNKATNHHPLSLSPKAQSSWLAKNIQEVERLLAADRETLRNNPESFSAQLSFQSTENRLQELLSVPCVFRCADCGRETTLTIDHPGFGLCPLCESRLMGSSFSWVKKSPADKRPPVGIQAAQRATIYRGEA